VTTVLVAGPAGAGGARIATRVGSPGTLRVVVGAVGLSLDEQIDAVQPDVLLVDLGATRVNAWLRDLGALRLPPAVVMLTDDPRPALGVDQLRRGGRAILPRQASSEEILAAIEAVAAGLVVLRPEAIAALRSASRARSGADAAVADQALTAREIEVLGLIAEGLGNKAIAARLRITGHTVKFHIASIFAKLSAGSRTEAVTIGVRLGLIMI
jgi:two-component system, NarL family, response regulator YdfI